MDAIDRLLCDWHEWQCGWQSVAGLPRESAFATLYGNGPIDNAWDSDEEADWRIIEITARMIDPLVLALDMRLRIAVGTAVRNLCAGRTVWTNPRWPATQDADYGQAKRVLGPQVVRLGLLSPSDLPFLTSRSS